MRFPQNMRILKVPNGATGKVRYKVLAMGDILAESSRLLVIWMLKHKSSDFKISPLGSFCGAEQKNGINRIALLWQRHRCYTPIN
jgi:hypothetical protein